MNLGGLIGQNFANLQAGPSQAPAGKALSNSAARTTEKSASTPLNFKRGTASKDNRTDSVKTFDAELESAQNGLPSAPLAGPSFGGPMPERPAPISQGALGVNPLKRTPGETVEDSGVDALTRRVVWNEFLRKMKDELGITAEDLVGAFASLNKEDLSAPPEQSADKIIMALGLNGQDATVAKKYFLDLVQRTKSQSMGGELATSQRQINLTLMSQREIERKALDRSIDRLNQKFFNTIQTDQNSQNQDQNIIGANPFAPKVQQVATGIPGAAAGGVAGSSVLEAGASPVGSAPVAPGVIPSAGSLSVEPTDVEARPTVDELLKQRIQNVSQSASGKSSSIVQDLNSNQVSALDDGAQQVGTSIDGSEATTASDVSQQASKLSQVSPQAMAQKLPPVDISQALNQAKPTAVGASAAATAASVPVAALNQLHAGLAGGDSSQDDDGDSSSDSSAVLNQALIRDQHQLANAKPNEFKAELGQVAQPVKVPELMDRAQIMVRDGGGEMKVTLSPDGLGDVAMKVSVDQGKVNVQLITESDHAKKLIENELHSLKSQLSANNLHLDQIKIDTATNLGKQLEQQYQDAQRQMAQQTLEQFRQDNQGWRRSFFELPSVTQYRGQAEAPRDVAPPRSSSRKSNNRRLDLVA